MPPEKSIFTYADSAEKNGNRLVWSGVVVTTAGLVSKLIEMPEGMPTTQICGAGLLMMVIGHSVKMIGNRPEPYDFNNPKYDQMNTENAKVARGRDAYNAGMTRQEWTRKRKIYKEQKNQKKYK